MRKFMLASTVVLFIVGQTMGASTVGMELELGGSNNDATCTNRVFFSPGSTADDEYELDANGRLTWALRIHAAGTHLNASQVEVPIRGIANFVFDLELYHDSVNPANLVTTATFMSTANEVMADCGIEQNWSNAPAGAPYLGNAAFAYVFDLNYTASPPPGPARAVDWWAVDASGHKGGGLRMDVRCYPKAAAGDGTLLGMGAGYSRWNKPVITERSTGGLGRPWGDDPVNWPEDFPSVPDAVRPHGFVNTTAAKASGDSVWGWLGYGPVCEGQIEGLQSGVNYILRVVPGGGINVLRNEAQSYTEVFAIAADTTVGDDINFTVIPPVIPVEILGWASVRQCGGVATPLPLDPAPALGTGATFTTETRLNGVQQIVVDFSRDVSDVYLPAGTVAISCPPTPGSCDMTVTSHILINGGQSLQIDVAGGTNGYCYAIDISGVLQAGAIGAGQEPNVDCVVQLLEGDVNGSGTVNTIDMAFIKTKVGTQVLPDNVRFDVNCSGTINTIDMAATKTKIGVVTATCE